MNREPTVAILGGSLSGNKGAASMLLAVVDSVRRRIPEARMTAFTPYPQQDRHFALDGEIAGFTPTDMVVKVLPHAVLSVMTGRSWRPRRGVAGRLAQADVAVDISGVAFMDGRGLVNLIYNVLLVLLPWAFGVPVFKMAQALGPFDQTLNRLAARFVLPRVSWIGLRGSATERHVKNLGLANAEPAADISFLLEHDEAATGAALELLRSERQVTVVAPSAVVERQSEISGIDYVDRVRRLIEGLRVNGHEVLIIAHSARVGAHTSRTNDLPVCRRIAEASSVPLIDAELDARVLRAVIARSRLLITSRFHAMISGLATGTPTFVVGWSHKYAEVLSEFDLDRWCVDFRDADDEKILQEVLDLSREAEGVRSVINAHLPSVRLQAERNMIPVIRALSET